MFGCLRFNVWGLKLLVFGWFVYETTPVLLTRVVLVDETTPVSLTRGVSLNCPLLGRRGAICVVEGGGDGIYLYLQL